MVSFNSEAWGAYAQTLAFCGNSLLDTMHHTGEAGLDPLFWETFPDFDKKEVVDAIADIKAFAVEAQKARTTGVDPATEISVEFTRLFMGPPRPAAAPWETFYRGGIAGKDEGSVGFGEATFQMQELLREAGLRVGTKSNQYADHMGIELLLASVYASWAADGDEDAHEKLASFLSAHPLNWIGSFRVAVELSAPEGYYVHILTLIEVLLEMVVPETVVKKSD